jgi:hypothetical protein
MFRRSATRLDVQFKREAHSLCTTSNPLKWMVGSYIDGWPGQGPVASELGAIRFNKRPYNTVQWGAREGHTLGWSVSYRER